MIAAMPVRALVLRSLATLFGISGAVAAITWLYFAMHALVHVGGGPCEAGDSGPAGVPCVDDILGLLPVVAGVGIGGLALYRVGVQAGPRLRFLLISAVFLTVASAYIDDGLFPSYPENRVSRLVGALIYLAPGITLLVFPLRNAAGWHRTFWADLDTGEEAH